MADIATSYDAPWKDVLSRFLPECLALFWPEAYAGINWQRGYEFLDKELRQVAPASAVGLRLVDALVKVWTTEGEEAWVLLHIEVQSTAVKDFPQRMFTYHVRIRELFNRDVASLAILTDTAPSWRPGHFLTGRWGNELSFRYPIVKLLDYQQHRPAIEASNNPFAIIVLAHLDALATAHDASARLTVKYTIVRRLRGKGWNREQTEELFRAVNWLLQLPDELENRFWHMLRADEEEAEMPYVTNLERVVQRIAFERGREEGREEGLMRGLRTALQIKFGDAGVALADELRAVADNALLLKIDERLPNAATLDEVRALLPQQ